MEIIVTGLVIVLVLAMFAVLIWWLLVETEGVYLGQRVVILLYDLYAQRYDRIKQYEPDYESHLLARPLMGFIKPLSNPLVLDIATGTGRLPLALLQHPMFHGKIFGIDLSRQMLRQAASNLSGYRDRASLLWGPAHDLPFPDDVFDVVTCLESLEFMPDQDAALHEMARVLRPGGLLLVTNRINARWMPGRTISDDEMGEKLHKLGFHDITLEAWQMDYNKLWGYKQGDSPPTGVKPLEEVLMCPRCPDAPMVRRDGEWFCTHCPAWTKEGDDGVVELAPLYRPIK